MSLILDALKKSDNERKTRIAPDMADVPTARRHSGPPTWIWWFVGLLVVNLAALLVVLTRGDTPADRAEPVAAAPVSAPQPAATLTIAPPPAKQAVESLAAAATPPRPAPADTPPSRDTVAAPAPSVLPAPAQSAAPRPTVRSAPPPPAEDLPLYDTLRAEGRINLAELNIDLHVYNAVATSRFVFINGSRYNEGDVLADGPTVREIRRDGVVLAHRGIAFLLPRE